MHADGHQRTLYVVRPVHLCVALSVAGCAAPREPVAPPLPPAGTAQVVWSEGRYDVARVVVAADGALLYRGRAPAAPLSFPVSAGDHFVQVLVELEVRSGLFGGVCRVQLKAGHPFVDEGGGSLVVVGVEERDPTVPWEDRFRVSFVDRSRRAPTPHAEGAEGAAIMMYPAQLVTTEGCEPMPVVDGRSLDASSIGPPVFGR